MKTIRATDEFTEWFTALRDMNAKGRIRVRLDRAKEGNLGDVKYFGGIGEMRINYGPGYRLYFVERGAEIILLLCGGDKSTQASDIKDAKRLREEYE